MLAFFARTGTVPWWTDSARPSLVGDSLDRLIRKAPRSLAAWMQSLSRGRPPRETTLPFPTEPLSGLSGPGLSGPGLRRIVLHCNDERLTALFGVLMSPSWRPLAVRRLQPTALLQACRATSGALSARLRTVAGRNALWLAVLHTACAGENRHTDPESFWREALARAAMELNMTYVAVVAGLRHALGSETDRIDAADPYPARKAELTKRQSSRVRTAPGLGDVRRLLDQLHQEIVPGFTSSGEVRRRSPWEEGATPSPRARTLAGNRQEEIEQLLERLIPEAGPMQGMFHTFRSLAGRLPGDVRDQWWVLLTDLATPSRRGSAAAREGRGDVAHELHPLWAQAFLRLLRPLVDRRLLSLGQERKAITLPANVVRRCLDELQGPAAVAVPTAVMQEITQLLREAVDESLEAEEGRGKGGKGRPGSLRPKPKAMEGLPESLAEARSTLAGGAGPPLHLGPRADTSPSVESEESRPRAVTVPEPSSVPRVSGASGTYRDPDRDTPGTAFGFDRGFSGLPLPPFAAAPAGGKRDGDFFVRLDTSDKDVAADSGPAPDSADQTDRALESLWQDPSPLSEALAALRSLTNRLPEQLQEEWWTALEYFETFSARDIARSSHDTRSETSHVSRARTLVRLLRPLVESRPPASGKDQGPRKEWIVPLATEEGRSKGGKGRPESPRPKPQALEGLPESLAEARSTLAGGAGPPLHLGPRADTSPSEEPDVARPRAVMIPEPSPAPRVSGASGTDRDTPGTAFGFDRGFSGLPLPPLAPDPAGGKRDGDSFPQSSWPVDFVRLDTSGEDVAADSGPAPDSADQTDRALESLWQDPSPFSEALATLRSLTNRLPEQLQEEWWTALEYFETFSARDIARSSHDTRSETSHVSRARTLVRLLRPLVESRPPASGKDQGPRKEWIVPLATEEGRSKGGKGRPESPRPKPQALEGLPESLAEARSTLAGGAGPPLHLGPRADTSPSEEPDVARPRAVMIPEPSPAPRVSGASGTDRDTPGTAFGFDRGFSGLPLPPLAPDPAGGKRDGDSFPQSSWPVDFVRRCLEELQRPPSALPSGALTELTRLLREVVTDEVVIDKVGETATPSKGIESKRTEEPFLASGLGISGEDVVAGSDPAPDSADQTDQVLESLWQDQSPFSEGRSKGRPESPRPKTKAMEGLPESVAETRSILVGGAGPPPHLGPHAETSPSEGSETSEEPDEARPRAIIIPEPSPAPRVSGASGTDRDTPGTAFGFDHGFSGLPLPPLAPDSAGGKRDGDFFPQSSWPVNVVRRCLEELQGPPPVLPSGTVTELIRLLREVVTEQRSATLKEEPDRPLRQPLSQGEDPHPLAAGATRAGLGLHGRPTRGLGNDPFHDTDSVCVENSGLVLLWPFLGHFFARLGLMAEPATPQESPTGFRDDEAVQRSVCLLQYLVTADPEPPEYQVILCKVLCGMTLQEIFDPGPAISPTEAEECTDLLSAVIAQAPILRNMSTAGFRGSFLLRRGVLSARDGSWLLRVERQTYDLVLDRFPWSVSWVRLPWMEAPLQVEW